MAILGLAFAAASSVWTLGREGNSVLVVQLLRR